MSQKGLMFFSLDTVFDDKVKLVEAEFGHVGFAVVVKLLQKIYREEGYYCEWNDDVALMFAKREAFAGVSVVSEIVKACIRRKLFDKKLYDDFGILTSAGIQKRFLSAKTRCVSVEIEKSYLLIDAAKIPQNVNIISGNVYRNEKNVDRKKEKKEINKKINKQQKEEANPADSSVAVAVALYEKNICPITPLTYEKLCDWLKDVDISLIEYAIEEAVSQNKRTWSYIHAILNNQFNAGHKTKAEAEGSRPQKKGTSAKYEFEKEEFDYAAIEARALGKCTTEESLEGAFDRFKGELSQ